MTPAHPTPPTLPDRADLDQLRRQARELLRAAQGGDQAALARVAAVSGDVRLNAAQLTIARELGFPSWTALKAAIERRPSIRPVASRAELAEAFAAAGAQFDPPITRADRRLADLDRRFDEDGRMMLVVCDPSVAGAGLAFRTKHGDVALRIIGLPARLRGQGLGRQLVERIIAEARALGSHTVAVGGVTAETRRFYERLGFHGRRSMMRRDL